MKIVKYFVVGGVAAGVDISIFFVFAKVLGLNYLAVSTVGFITATLVNYLLSIRHVFESGVRFSKKKELFFVYAVSVIALSVNQTVLFVMVDLVKGELMFSKVVATGSVFLWNYYARKNYVFAGADERSIS